MLKFVFRIVLLYSIFPHLLRWFQYRVTLHPRDFMLAHKQVLPPQRLPSRVIWCVAGTTQHPPFVHRLLFILATWPARLYFQMQMSSCPQRDRRSTLEICCSMMMPTMRCSRARWITADSHFFIAPFYVHNSAGKIVLLNNSLSQAVALSHPWRRTRTGWTASTNLRNTFTNKILRNFVEAVHFVLFLLLSSSLRSLSLCTAYLTPNRHNYYLQALRLGF